MGRSRVAGALCILVAVLFSGPGLAVAEYACSMSGEVSKACCCAPSSDDGCPSVERACSCCDVSYTDARPNDGQPATSAGTSSQEAAYTWPVSEVGIIATAPFHGISTTHSAAFQPSPPIGLYLLKSSLLR